MATSSLSRYFLLPGSPTGLQRPTDPPLGINFFAAVANILGQAYVLGEKETGFGVSVIIGQLNGQFVHHHFLYGPPLPLPLSQLVAQPGFERISKMLESNSL